MGSSCQNIGLDDQNPNAVKGREGGREEARGVSSADHTIHRFQNVYCIT